MIQGHIRWGQNDSQKAQKGGGEKREMLGLAAGILQPGVDFRVKRLIGII